MDKYIREALNHNRYANYCIMGIEKNAFEDRLNEMTAANIIKQRYSNNTDFETTLNYMLVASADKSIVISSTIAPKVEIKVADQIGLANAQIANL